MISRVDSVRERSSTYQDVASHWVSSTGTLGHSGALVLGSTKIRAASTSKESYPSNMSRRGLGPGPKHPRTSVKISEHKVFDMPTGSPYIQGSLTRLPLGRARGSAAWEAPL